MRKFLFWLTQILSAAVSIHLVHDLTWQFVEFGRQHLDWEPVASGTFLSETVAKKLSDN